MKKILILLIALVLFSSHDMFLKLDGYFLKPNSAAQIKLFNGTFELSENTIDRNRMLDVSLVGNGNRMRVDTAQWSEKDGMTILDFSTGEAGTWVAGVSTRPRNIEMAAQDFNNYLEHDGVLDMLASRKANNTLDQAAVEKYSKHVKTIFQVGEQLTDDWKTVLGYPIEFVPLSNPYDLHAGHDLKVKLLWQDKPLANQLVYIGSKPTAHTHSDETAHSHDHGEDAHSHSHDDDQHSHEHDGEKHSHDHDDSHSHSHDGDNHSHEHNDGKEDHHHHEALQARTDANGVFTMNIDQEGIWYVRTIHLATSEEAGLTHESNWATLTFEVGHEHSHTADHSHAQDHHHHHDESEVGIPSALYWIGSLVIVLGLFLFFNRRKA